MHWLSLKHAGNLKRPFAYPSSLEDASHLSTARVKVYDGE
jgi:hypothetical protein